MYTNTNALSNKMDKLRIFVDEKRPTFILITETWLSSEISDSLVAIPGYVLHRQDRDQKRGGGVCVFSRGLIHGHDVKITQFNDYVMPLDVDMIWVRAQISMVKMQMLCVYRPGYTTHQADQTLIEVIGHALSSNLPTYIYVVILIIPKLSSLI